MLDMSEFPNFKELVKTTFSAYTRSGSTIVKFLFLSFIGPFLIFLLGMLPSAMTNNSVLFVPLFIIGAIIMIYTQTWFAAALILAAADVVADKEIQIGAVLAKARSKVVQLWWLGLLQGAIVLGGLILFIVPGILFSLWFSLASYILVLEGVKGMNALLKSKEYMKGFIGHVFISLFFFQLLVGVFQFVPTEILNAMHYETIATGYNLIAQIVIAPLIVIFTYLLYKNIKRQKSDAPNEYPQPRKNKYFFVALLAPIVALILVAAGIWFAGNLMKDYQNAPQDQNDQSIEDSMSLMILTQPPDC